MDLNKLMETSNFETRHMDSPYHEKMILKQSFLVRQSPHLVIQTSSNLRFLLDYCFFVGNLTASSFTIFADNQKSSEVDG